MQTVEKYEVKRAVRREIEVDVPGSKSITNRALLIAALAEGILYGQGDCQCGVLLQGCGRER